MLPPDARGHIEVSLKGIAASEESRLARRPAHHAIMMKPFRDGV
jgi:hypothetical protein